MSQLISMIKLYATPIRSTRGHLGEYHRRPSSPISPTIVLQRSVNQPANVPSLQGVAGTSQSVFRARIVPVGRPGRPGRSCLHAEDRSWRGSRRGRLRSSVLLLVVFGIIDFGRMLNTQISVTEAAAQGVRVASFGGDPTERVEEIAGEGARSPT